MQSGRCTIQCRWAGSFSLGVSVRLSISFSIVYTTENVSEDSTHPQLQYFWQGEIEQGNFANLPSLHALACSIKVKMLKPKEKKYLCQGCGKEKIYLCPGCGNKRISSSSWPTETRLWWTWFHGQLKPSLQVVYFFPSIDFSELTQFGKLSSISRTEEQIFGYY